MSASTSPATEDRFIDADPTVRPAHLLARAMDLCFAISAALVSFYPLFSKLPWMVYEEDDFFYYLKIADNFAHGHGSTFNGVVATNGYHPLWFALLALTLRLSSSTTFLEIFLSIVILIATLTTFFLMRRLFLQQQASPLLSSAFAAALALYTAHLFTPGMEVLLAIPLLLGVAVAYQSRWPWQPKVGSGFCFGLLLSALFLSRLDTFLMVAPLLAATCIHPKLRGLLTRRQVMGVCIGLLPCFLYVLSNQLFFHTWLPISGMAKQLRTSHLPSAPAWHSLFSKTPKQLLSVGLIGLAIVLLPVVYKRLTAMQQVLYPLLLVFPFLYLLLLSCLSDWQVWDWYFYSIRVASCIAIAILLLWKPSRRLLTHAAVTGIIVAAAFAQIFLNRRYPSTAGGMDIYEAAIEIRGFAQTHPGIYAMGDRSGMVGYLLPDPVVQTEGLVMDRGFLQLIQKQIPLEQVLAQYHTDYYIATSHTPFQGCFHASEPAQAGPASPHISAIFCQPPLATFTHHQWITMIFRLHASPQPAY